MCNTELVWMNGNQTHPNDTKCGVTVWCPSKDCPAQEVSGHGSSLKDAYAVIQSKYSKQSETE